MPRLRASGAPSPIEVPARVEPRRPMAPVAKRMLSSRLVLPERYGPHSATTRCAPLPGLPRGMVSDLMSSMDNVLPFAARAPPPEGSGRWMVATELGRSEALSGKSFHPDDGESIHRVRATGCGEDSCPPELGIVTRRRPLRC